MQLKLNPRFANKLQKKIGKYTIDVGILNDGEHMQAVESRLHEVPSLSTYAGGSIRKKSAKSSGKTISDIFIENQERLDKDFLREPFLKKSSEIIRFSEAFMKMIMGSKSMTKRVENLAQAIIRNPILRGDYGGNTASTADAKGFDRGLIDTAQMFKAIRARVVK